MNETTTDYTAHVTVPDGLVGTMFHEILMTLDNVTFSALRVGATTWLSFGVNASSDDEATTLILGVMYSVSRLEATHIPEGYDESLPQLFETAPLVVTSGRTVVFSQGVM